MIARYGFHRWKIYGWLKAAQERQVFRWVNGKPPPAVRIRFLGVDAAQHTRIGQPAIRCAREPGLDRRAVGSTRFDPAETPVARLPARDLPRDRTHRQAGQGRDLFL